MQALYFDGRSGRARPVRLSLAEGRLSAAPEPDGPTAELPAAWHWPLSDVQWPERTRHGQRVIELKGGGTLVVADTAAFDAWRAGLAAQHGVGERLVVRLQQRWRNVVLALVLLGLALVAGYRWGVPAVAAALVALVPPAAEQRLGDAALETLDREWFKPTQLDVRAQREWRTRFAALLERAAPAPRSPWQLHFRRGGDALGANALALPGGHIVITDELLELLAGHDDTVLGVLAHEYGHLEHRHGLNAVVRFSLLSLGVSAALGDFSTVIAAVPVLLAHAGYARDAERQADAVSARLLRDSGRSPAVMVLLFERMAAQRDAKPRADAASAPDGKAARPPLPIALASHPADEERVRFFRDAAR